MTELLPSRDGVDDVPTDDSITTKEGWRRFADDNPKPPALRTAAELAALSPRARSVLVQARKDYHSNLPLAATPTMRQLLTTGRLLIQLNRGQISARRGIILSGASGTGKTTALTQVGRAHERVVRRRHPGFAGAQRIPVVYVTVPTARSSPSTRKPSTSPPNYWTSSRSIKLRPAPPRHAAAEARPANEPALDNHRMTSQPAPGSNSEITLQMAAGFPNDPPELELQVSRDFAAELRTCIEAEGQHASGAFAHSGSSLLEILSVSLGSGGAGAAMVVAIHKFLDRHKGKTVTFGPQGQLQSLTGYSMTDVKRALTAIERTQAKYDQKWATMQADGGNAASSGDDETTPS